MGKTYEHTFSDLNGTPDEPTDTSVDLGQPAREDATGAKIINPAPGNPDAGKADQFDDVGGRKVDEGIDILEGTESEDEVATGGEETEGDGDDDLKGLSDSVRKRIQRERRLREEAEERQRTTEAQFAELNKKVDLQGKESEWTRADEKDDATLVDLRAKKVTALEAGETGKVVDLDDKITDVKADKRARDAERAKLREAAKAPVKTEEKPLNPKAKAWIDAHPQYKDNASFRAATHAADQFLYQSGENLNSDGYYVKLTKMLAEKFNIAEDDPYLKRKVAPRGGPRGTGSVGTRGGATNTQVNRSENGRTQVVITKAEKAMAAAMGLDVNDPAVLKSMAREKVVQARAERSE